MRVCVSLPRPPWRWILLLSALGIASCSGAPSYNPVKGSVLYQSRPVDGIVVTLHTKDGNPLHAAAPSGITKPDGSFELSTGSAPGAPTGDYVVTFTWPKSDKPAGKISMNPEVETSDKLEGKYANATSSSFKVTIKKGKNQLDPFQLK